MKETAPQYANVEVEFRGGANPDMFFYDAQGELVDQVNLAKLTHEQCVAELEQRGFALKQAAGSGHHEL